MTQPHLPQFQGVPRPRIYHWIGTSSDELYWDDRINWAEGEYPDHPEATAMFLNALDRDITIRLRKDIRLANLWFSEPRHSYTIAADGDRKDIRLLFMTGQQLANITLDEENKATHTILVLILHSCKKLWGAGWQTVSPSKAPDPIPSNTSMLRLAGDIGSYKAAPRASLNLDGYLDVELSGNNSFLGPVVVNRGTLHVKRSESIPPGTSLLVYDPGKLIIDKDVQLRVCRLCINDHDMSDGEYLASNLRAFSGAGSILVSKALSAPALAS